MYKILKINVIIVTPRTILELNLSITTGKVNLNPIRKEASR